MTTSGRIAGHPVQVMLGALTCALGAVATVFTPAGLVPLAAGLMLIFRHRLRVPVAALVAGAAVGAVAGPCATLVVRSERLCCMFGWSEARGWPFAWLSRGASADDPVTARRLGRSAGWEADPVQLAGTVVLWAYAGLLVFAVLGLGWRAWRGRRPATTAR
ncbi:hypothetical protein [Actinoplanes teichomyceticus]|uniref:Uncharacterized protein n=1 Tax=Actinoplanes teichomyceticus TaxID=1867 RepID=A0A561WPH7_ACTTI|nr:hypothetical protein [Actinoplanes teichomyceticus]TWG25772.1 hypothetical protein FHX34_101744 [Actinoplanes teichomyceticus]GIF10847.1 hypothetical protein Ate01nite_08790 [Actinoplanes teichomyceticus]